MVQQGGEGTAADALRAYQAVRDDDEQLAQRLWQEYLRACEREMAEKRAA